MKLTHLFLPLFPVFLLAACRVMQSPSRPSVTQYTIRDTTNGQAATEIEQFLKPYRDSLKQFTEAVLGEARGNFKKEKPGGSLGNLVVDAVFEAALRVDPRCRGAMFNYGGIRLPDLMQGPVTRGKLLELLPFDNEVVILSVRGDTLQTWLNLVASKGGWPVQFGKTLVSAQGTIRSLGADTMEVQQADGSLKRVIAERMIRNDSIYQIATIDYIANGGDNCEFLKPCARRSSGKLARDIVTAFIEQHQQIYPDTTRRILFIP